MAFRTIVIDTHSKIEYSLNYLVFRTVDEIKRIHLDEIHTVIFQSTAVSVTTSILVELIKRKIKVIFCDERKNPLSELVPYYGSHNTSKRISEQIKWSENLKGLVWQKIVKEKILNQSITLELEKKISAAQQLKQYFNEVEFDDITNREGHAAKVYFNNIFYEGFTRNDSSFCNACLDYGYTILLSQINRAVVAAGYITQIGIHHRGEFNEFNLSSDLIEPFRFLVDEEALILNSNDDFKERMIKILSKSVLIDGKLQSVTNALNIYVLSVFNALESNNINNIKFISHNGNI